MSRASSLLLGLLLVSPDAFAATTVTTLDSIGAGYRRGALAIGADGLGLITYYAPGVDAAGDLRVAHCSNVLCTNATISTLAGTVSAGDFSSVAIGADGLALISFIDHGPSPDALMVAHCNDVQCSSATLSTLDSNPGAGMSSLEIGSDGLGLIAYASGFSSDTNIRTAHCLDVACTSATVATIAGLQPTGYPSLAIQANGLGLISFQAGSQLKLAECSNLACSSVQRSVIGVSDGVTSLAVTAGNRIVASSDADNDLLVTSCRFSGCPQVVAPLTRYVSRIAASQLTGGEPGPSLAIGTDGYPLIVYADANHAQIRAAHCDSEGCENVTRRVVGSAPAPVFSQVAIGADGLPLIAYGDFDGDIKVAHCSNRSCTP